MAAERRVQFFKSRGSSPRFVTVRSYKRNGKRVRSHKRKLKGGIIIPDVKKAMRTGFSTAPPLVQELGFGAGMGLPNIKKCADKMNINSVAGKGTEIELIIYTKGKK